MDIAERNELMENNLGLLRKLAWSYNKSTGIEYEELFEEACLGFLYSIERYDPEKAKLSTWVFFAVGNHLNNFIKGKVRNSISLEDLSIRQSKVLSTPAKANQNNFLEDFLENISIDGKEVVQVILQAPGDLFLNPPKMARGAIRDLLKGKGWSWERIWNSLSEVQNALS